MSNRDAIRSKIFQAPKQAKIEVEYEGVKVEMRKPKVKVRDSLFLDALTEVKDSEGKVTSKQDMHKFNTLGLLATCYVPGTDEKIFDKADIEAMAECDCGGFYDELVKRLPEVLSLKQDKEIEKK